LSIPKANTVSSCIIIANGIAPAFDGLNILVIVVLMVSTLLLESIKIISLEHFISWALFIMGVTTMAAQGLFVFIIIRTPVKKWLNLNLKNDSLVKTAKIIENM
jgi:hypothetical protein